MKNISIKWLRAGTMIVGLSVVAFACQKNGKSGNDIPAGQTGVKVFLTDDPSLTFDDVFIDIQKLEIKVEDSADLDEDRRDQGGNDAHDNDGDTQGGWMSLSIHPGVYDILKFRNGLDTLFASSTFPSVRTLKKIRITLGSNNSVVVNGNTFPVLIKNNDNIVVINLGDDVLSLDNNQFLLSLDFDAGRSIRQHGDRLELDPQIRIFTKQRAGSIEGSVLPVAANAVVMAINGVDTSTAKPGREGEYEIVGLKAGSYSLLIHATAANFQDTTITNVIVREKDDTHVGAVTLHP